MKRTSWWLVTALVLVAACQNNNRQKTAEEVLKQAAKTPGINAGTGTFDITAPSGWSRLDTSLNGVRATLLLAPVATSGARASVNVVSESMSNMSLDKYFDISIDNMGKFMQGYQPGAKGDKVIDGTPAKYAEYSQTPSGLPLDAICYIVPHNGIAYVITCTAPHGQMDQYRSQFDESVQSFHVH